MPALSRTDNSIVGRWWWTVDKWTLLALFLLATAGMMMTMAASPPMAYRLGLDPQHFVIRHAMLLPFALVAMIAISTMSLKAVRRLALAMFVISLFLMVLTVTTGEEVKGASRWIYIFGFSIQPSEFVKPAFAVVTAWLLAPRSANEEIPGAAICTLIFTMIIALLMAQPDIGQAGVFMAVWLSQWFLAGLSIAWIGGSAVMGGMSLMAAYFVFPHVALRIDRFMNPNVTSYQIERATQAFMAGGYTGEGRKSVV